MRLTIDEYSKQYKMSKEMIKSKLKSRKINYIIEDSVTYIIVEDVDKNTPIKTQKTEVQKSEIRPKTTVATVIALYQRENAQLKEKIMQLENKIDKLIGDKEQMLRDERDKIEQLYTNKDEQLRNILELVNTKMMIENQNQAIHEVETYEQETKQLKKEEEFNGVIELKEYLKTLNLKSRQRKSIKRKFISICDKDVRIINKSGKLYLDFSKYDYSDLLSY